MVGVVFLYNWSGDEQKRGKPYIMKFLDRKEENLLQAIYKLSYVSGVIISTPFSIRRLDAKVEDTFLKTHEIRWNAERKMYVVSYYGN